MIVMLTGMNGGGSWSVRAPCHSLRRQRTGCTAVSCTALVRAIAPFHADGPLALAPVPAEASGAGRCLAAASARALEGNTNPIDGRRAHHGSDHHALAHSGVAKVGICFRQLRAHRSRRLYAEKKIAYNRPLLAAAGSLTVRGQGPIPPTLVCGGGGVNGRR